MVVIDNYDGTQARKPPAPGPNSTLGGSTTHPEDPPPYGAQHGTYHVHTPGEDRRLLVGPVDGQQPAWRRFGKALLVAIVVYALCGMLLGSWVWRGRWGKDLQYEWPGEYPVPVGVKTRGCLGPSDWPITYALPSILNTTSAGAGALDYRYASTKRFELPLSSASLYLLSRGAYSAGSVDIITSAEQKHDSVSMVVMMKYYSEDVKRVVKVCRVARGEGEDGVGLFSPSRQRGSWPESQVYFETLIVFPELGHWAPLVVTSLETDVHNTLHRVHAVVEQVKFAKLKLQGTNGPIQATSLSTDEGLIQTSNAEIYGNFNGTRSLTLASTNGAILVSVKMVRGYDVEAPTELDIRTTSGTVEANIDLRTASQSGRSGRNRNSARPTFYVNTSTTNSRMQTNFWHQPADSTLIYHGSTTNGFAQTQLHSAFQGEFKVQTTQFTPQLVVKEEDPSDPSGRGRRRKVETHEVGKGMLTGSVEWVGRRHGERSDTGRGRLALQTTNSHAVVVL